MGIFALVNDDPDTQQFFSPSSTFPKRRRKAAAMNYTTPTERALLP
jgi:hypothetical protein